LNVNGFVHLCGKCDIIPLILEGSRRHIL
jgi:hypothetical protein